MSANPERRVRQHQMGLAALGIAVVFFVYDLAEDAFWADEFGSVHFTIETVVFVGLSVALAIGVRDLRRLRVDLEREEKRNEMFSEVLVDNIDALMDEWRITKSEKDIAWLIIKGYRFSEIARARRVKETTVRLQAASLYSKAGVSGRAEFAAEIILPLLTSAPMDVVLQSQQTTAPSDPN
ncbi:MAG: LuxR C-terminal-related transcriptional regulator [Candidatus Tectomicrobia bacterium]|nr:LuxR C-terminal-related transcriptional regulator [Candidatus Tectomicrobia bacterium]